MKNPFTQAQPIGRALMLPLALLPFAALLWRVGQPDLLNLSLVAALGDAILANIGLLFAIGVASGLARDNHGAAALAAAVGYIVAMRGAEILMQVPAGAVAGLDEAARAAARSAYLTHVFADVSLPLGILAGAWSGALYNRLGTVKLGEGFAYFGGRRLVPLASAALGVVAAVLVSILWPLLESGMDVVAPALIDGGSSGLFAFGFLDRLLMVTGLQHVIDSFAWAHAGNFHGIVGDLNRFNADDPSAGTFMSGFFPVAMFGLPAACFAMYRSAQASRRRAAGGLLLAIALTSLVTGITAPVEFVLLFLAPVLFIAHAILTGSAMVAMDVLNSRLGFTHAPGAIDFVLNLNRATDPWLLLPIGGIYAIIYYAVFRVLIVRYNLKTPGRDPEGTFSEERALEAAPVERGVQFMTALGGAANLRLVEACKTRVRLDVVSRSAIDVPGVQRLGARKLSKSGKTGVHFVIGAPDVIAAEINAGLMAALAANGDAAGPRGERRASERAAGETLPPGEQVIAGLGGAENVEQLEAVTGRVLIRVKDAGMVDEEVLRSLGVRGVAILEPDRVHLLHANAEALMGVLDALIDQH